MRLVLVDTNPAVVDGWRLSFAGADGVDIVYGDILSVAKGVIVSPANSYGFMDGGIDRQYLEHFGAGLQEAVASTIARRPEGHLPIGAAAIVRTENDRIPFMILAPTVVFPGAADRDAPYRAFRAVLRIAGHRQDMGPIYCPGLGTGVGLLPPEVAANGMAQAYRDWLEFCRNSGGGLPVKT